MKIFRILAGVFATLAITLFILKVPSYWRYIAGVVAIVIFITSIFIKRRRP